MVLYKNIFTLRWGNKSWTKTAWRPVTRCPADSNPHKRLGFPQDFPGKHDS